MEPLRTKQGDARHADEEHSEDDRWGYPEPGCVARTVVHDQKSDDHESRRDTAPQDRAPSWMRPKPFLPEPTGTRTMVHFSTMPLVAQDASLENAGS
jgi:hypothetical protein